MNNLFPQLIQFIKFNIFFPPNTKPNIQNHGKTQKQKHVTLFNIPVHMGIKDNQVAEKLVKEAIGVTTTRLTYTNYYSAINKTGNSKWQKMWDISTSKSLVSIEEWENTY